MQLLKLGVATDAAEQPQLESVLGAEYEDVMGLMRCSSARCSSLYTPQRCQPAPITSTITTTTTTTTTTITHASVVLMTL